MRLTRRQLAVTLASSAALAQAPSTPSSPDAELKAARDRLRENAEALARREIPMVTEPAFQFKA